MEARLSQEQHQCVGGAFAGRCVAKGKLLINFDRILTQISLISSVGRKSEILLSKIMLPLGENSSSPRHRTKVMGTRGKAFIVMDTSP